MDFGAPRNNTQAREHLAWDAGQLVQDAWRTLQDGNATIEREIVNLEATLEAMRLAYNRALEERNEMHKMLVSAEGRLGEVHKVVQRYTSVQEPVVASDGYTYERAVIQQYLEECRRSENKAYSQLTKEVLSESLLPNQSLKKLVELLKTVKPQKVNDLVELAPLEPVQTAAAAAAAAAASERLVQPAIHASELEAGFQKPEDYAGAPPGYGDRKADRKSERSERPERAGEHRGADRHTSERHPERTSHRDPVAKNDAPPQEPKKRAVVEPEPKRQPPTSFAAAVASKAAASGPKAAAVKAKPPTVTATAPQPKSAAPPARKK